MEQNIADLLKDTFLEIDFEHLQSDEDTLHTSQTVLVMDAEIEDASKLRTSEQGSVETITAVYEPEENDSSSDNCESESGISLSINTESTFYFSRDEINNQVVNTMMAEAKHLNDAVGECTAEEGDMPSYLEADVFEKDRTEEEHIETLDVEYEPQTSPPMSRECQTPEETSSEESEQNSDNCESESEAHQLNDAVGECTAEEGNMASDLEAGVSEKDRTEEEHIETLDVEYEPQASPPMSRECQTPEETSSEESEQNSDNCESESGISLSINTESTFCFSHDEIDNQVVNMTIAEAHQLNDAVGECTAEEGNMASDLEAGVSEKDRTEEEHIETLDVEYEPQASPPMSRECQTPEETSSEENESNSDNCEGEASNSLYFNTDSIFCLSHDEINNQVVKGMMAEAQQLNDAAGECTAEEGNMLRCLEAGVSEKDRTEEEHIESLNVEYEPQVSPLMSKGCQTPEETSSESDEELPENYNTPQSSLCKSVDIKEEPFLATSSKNADKYYVRDDMKEFTEEDQEQIEESLADYPSDLSHSESEEPSLEPLFNAENVNLQNQESPDLDYNSGIKGLEVELISASVDVDLSIQREDEDGVQGSFINDINTEEDITNKEDPVDLSDVSDQTDNISDSSSDDRSSSQEETNIISSVNQEEEMNHVSQYNYLTVDMLRVDNDIGYMYKDTGVLDAISPEKKDEEHSLFWERGFTNTSSISYYKESNTELHHSTELVQSDTALKDHEVSSSETSDNVEDTKNALTEVLWSSSLLMDDDILHMEEYDWDLTGEGEDLVPINSGEGEKQENEEEALEELDIDDNEEGNERDWELEKTRIEAFYQFYGDQAEPEDEVGRNHKVTFCLDQESSSSEREEDSESSEEEVDSDLHMPEFSTLKPEYISESDDDPLENPYYLERPKLQPKEQQPVNVPVKQPPRRNKCLAVLKSILAFGFLTAIGIVSFWWATENMDWIH
ncbi:uncharacterized protein si:dkey-183p4.10 isoform X2 [Hemibagrus wyckioides]|uniref:uncharacterized protein si:dkey-183p4.10 isoform X2 n=1 Tax=Hemibagrus wyckioides TaxID=337641 RepID=UPI00266DA470|nr:uncharacterized protein si:dkey-183p4.10 isoform X2 [Hemibagrus wyckioides]